MKLSYLTIWALALEMSLTVSCGGVGSELLDEAAEEAGVEEELPGANGGRGLGPGRRGDGGGGGGFEDLALADNTPDDNPTTTAGAALGRVLFYDQQLSLSNTTSCGSCHIQELGFADGTRLSTGFDGQLTGRNSMSLANAKYYRNGRFFWDERAETLEEQVLMPIQDELEMGLEIDVAVSRIASDSSYTSLFESAFGDGEVTSDRMAKALAQFVRSMESFDSRFDQGLALSGGIREDFPNYSDLENQGKSLFFSRRNRCASCHRAPAFVATRARNNGLGAGAMKVPSLKNIALTGPYMHDGRFDSLEQVVEHYSSGIAGGGRGIRNLNLSDGEKSALVAFLRTLTDETFLNDPQFSDPNRL